jgi:hypothetical protein
VSPDETTLEQRESKGTNKGRGTTTQLEIKYTISLLLPSAGIMRVKKEV